MIYFTSDHHFYHSNIIRYCKRPFLKEGDLDNQGNWSSQFLANQRVGEMNAELIRRWNERVGPDDTVFHLGDFCLTKSSEAPDAPKDTFKELRHLLNGDIIFFAGNHDGNNKNKSAIESMIIKHGGHRIYMTHNPKFYRKDFEWNFCGHTHGNEGTFKRIGKSIIVDLSVENWDYRPVDINEIKQAYSQWIKQKKK